MKNQVVNYFNGHLIRLLILNRHCCYCAFTAYQFKFTSVSVPNSIGVNFALGSSFAGLFSISLLWSGRLSFQHMGQHRASHKAFKSFLP